MGWVQNPNTGEPEWYDDEDPTGGDPGLGNPSAPPNTPPTQTPLPPGVQGPQTPDERNASIRDQVMGDFASLLARAPTDAEVAEAISRYNSLGGTLMREYIVGLRGAGSSSGGGGGGGRGSLAPPNTLGWMPTYVGPVWDQPDPFVAPTLEEAKNEPGYKFALQQGQEAMENTAGMKGILRTGGTAKALIGYGQRAAETNYNNVFNRAADIWDKNYGMSKDMFIHSTQRNAEQEFAPRAEEAKLGFQALMDIWKKRVDVAGNLFEEGSD